MKLETVLIVIIVISLILSFLCIHPTFSDDNFYFNVGKNILNGKIPYKDFFFAHPPLQVYILAILFRIFGSSYLVAKLYSLSISALCLPMIYLIMKELNGKTAFISAFTFIVTPTFIAFSSMGYGMWEAALFVLISTYFSLKDKPIFSSLFLSIATFFRYVAAFYFPFLLLIFYFRKGKLLKFFLSSLVLLSFFFIIFFSIFGQSYFQQTIFYHIFSKVETARKTQYWEIGLFFYFLALISALPLFVEKEKVALLFAFIPIILDPIILSIFRLSFYHYFLISLPFCIMAASKAITLKYSIVKIMIPLIIFLSLIFNLQTIDFYLNPIHSKNFQLIAEFIEKNTSEDEKIFGEPIITNYVSFETGRDIAGNYFDSYLQHLTFEGLNKVVKNLEKDKPKFIIEMDGYYLNSEIREFIAKNYDFERKFEGTPNYSIYVLK